MVRFVGRFVRPSKETTSSLVPPSFLVVVAPLILRRTKKFGGKFHPRDCALSLSRKGRSRSGSNRSSLREEREAGSSATGTERNNRRNYYSIVEKNLSSFIPVCISASSPPKNRGERRSNWSCVPRRDIRDCVCGNRAFQRSEADTELDESGEERRGKRGE